MKLEISRDITFSSQLRLLHELTDQLEECLTVAEVTECFLNSIMPFLKFNDGVLYVKLGDILQQIGAYTPENPENTINQKVFAIPLGHGFVGNVALYGKSEIHKEIAKNPRYIVDDNSRNSEITVPIFFKNEVIGVIDSESHNSYAYTSVHLHFLEMAAKVCSPFLQKALLTQKNIYSPTTIVSEVNSEKSKLIQELYSLKEASEFLDPGQTSSTDKKNVVSRKELGGINLFSRLLRKKQRNSIPESDSIIEIFKELLESSYFNSDISIISEYHWNRNLKIPRSSFRFVLKSILSHTIKFSQNTGIKLSIASKLFQDNHYFFFTSQNSDSKDEYHVSAIQGSFFLYAAREVLKKYEGTVKVRKSFDRKELRFSLYIKASSNS